MSMSAGNNEGGVNAEINITPLADVMLVLLIIFMITAPMSSHQVKVTLPKTVLNQTEKPKNKAPPIDLAIKADGNLYWNDSAVSEAELQARLARDAQKSPQPALQIRADHTVRYKAVRKVLQTAKAAGMVHIGFVTNAPAKNSD